VRPSGIGAKGDGIIVVREERVGYYKTFKKSRTDGEQVNGDKEDRRCMASSPSGGRDHRDEMFYPENQWPASFASGAQEESEPRKSGQIPQTQGNREWDGGIPTSKPVRTGKFRGYLCESSGYTETGPSQVGSFPV
jgi:hypothetical protein